MPTTVEQNRMSDVIIPVDDPLDTAVRMYTISAGQTLALGTVLGRITSTGKMVQLDPNAADGSEDAWGVLAEDVDATGGDAEALVSYRNCVLNEDFLIWPAGITSEQKTAAIEQLKARKLLVRPGA